MSASGYDSALRINYISMTCRIIFRHDTASAEIQGEFLQTNSRVNIAGDFGGLILAIFLGKDRRDKSTQKSTSKFKSEFGSFVATKSTLQGSGLDISQFLDVYCNPEISRKELQDGVFSRNIP